MAQNEQLVITDYSSPAIEGTVALFSCSRLGYELTGPRSATCTRNGEWVPDPRQVQCQGNLLCNVNSYFKILVALSCI